MRILFFTQSGFQGASSRYRAYQFLPLLRDRGWTCWVAPAVPERLHGAYFFSRRWWWKAFLSVGIFLRRCAQISLVPVADVVFIQKPLLPVGWPPLECIVARLARKVVFDFDDAIFLPSPAGQTMFSERKLRHRFQRILGSANLVLAGNAFLAEEARTLNPRVEMFPTVVDTRRFSLKRGSNAPAVIGWMGSPATAPYLRPLAAVLRQLAQEYPLRLVLVGAYPCHPERQRRISSGIKDPSVVSLPQDDNFHGVDVVFEAWDYSNEVAQLQSFDVFIAPLDDTPWEQGKCGLKALTAMSSGLPVVASAVGVHREIIVDGDNGFLALTPAEWKDKLGRLLSDNALREKIGTQARKTILQRYDLTAAADRLAALLSALSPDFVRGRPSHDRP